MTMKLYTYPNNYRAHKALVCAAYNGARIEVPSFEMGRDNKTPEFLELFPPGKVPALETEQGGIFESNAIARYVARCRPEAQLYGRTLFESAQIDSFVDMCAFELEPSRNILVLSLNNVLDVDRATFDDAMADFKKALATLEQHLLECTYLVGQQVTLADIVMVCALASPFALFVEPNTRREFTNVTRWMETCLNQPQFKKVLGTVQFCSQAAAAPKAGKAKAANQQQQKKQQKQSKPAPASPAAKPAPASPAAKPAATEQKAAAPTVPDSTMDMDNWKRTFSNNPPEEAMKQFWEMFDQNGFSLWLSDYMYNDENRVKFMTANLIGGYFQRLERLRKIGFGAMNMLSQELDAPPFCLHACWLFRGLEVPEIMTECPDSEYYTWKKVDTSDPQQRKLVEDMWINQDSVLGMKVNEKRIYK